MDPDEQASYHELCAYTLSRGDAEFIHQHVVDAWGPNTWTRAASRSGPRSR